AVHDRDLKYIYVSQRYLNDYKVKESEIIGKHHYEVFPDLPPKWRDVHQKALMGEVSSAEDDPYMREDGSVDWTRWECRPWYEADGSIGGIVVYTEVITERKLVEKELQKFRTITDRANYGCTVASPDGKLLYVNDTFARMHGWEPQELLGRNLSVFHSKEQMARVHELLGSIAKDGSFAIEEVWHQRRDGSIFPTLMNATMIRSTSGEPEFISATAIDITEFKQAQDELRKSKEKLSLAMQVSSTGFWDLDLDTNETYMSQEIYSMCGYEPGEIAGNMKTFIDQIHPDDRESAIGAIDKSIREMAPLKIDVRIRKKSGEWIWASMNGKPTDFDESSRPHHLIGTQVNITSGVKAEESLLYAKIAAEEANRMKDEILSNVSHEFRTPLSAVIGFSDVLLSDGSEGLSISQREYVGHIHQSGKNLLSIVERMLDFSNAKYGSMNSLELQSVNVSELVLETGNILYKRALNKNVKISTVIDDELKTFVADRQKLLKVLYNLLENAIKFTGSGGFVKIEVKNINYSVRFSVQDNGIGIERKKFDTLFEPFVQIDGSISRRYGGTGLGLALVKKLVEMHNGRIWVESEIGRGSTFVFEIPLIIK
uniref:PAS domain S-box protein n=1 Tax=Methanomethylovorans sp. TaxID=2758717 RepID=UPI00351CB54D